MQGKSQPYKMGGWRRIILQKITHTSFIHSNLPSLTTSPSKKWRSLPVSSHWWLLPPPCWPRCKRLHSLDQADREDSNYRLFLHPQCITRCRRRRPCPGWTFILPFPPRDRRYACEKRWRGESSLLCNFRIGTHSLNFTSHLDTLRQTRYRKAREVRSDFLYLTRFNEI